MKRILLIFVSMMIAFSTSMYAEVPTEESVTKLYVATFNRAPDAAGLDYWLNDSGLQLEEIAKSFFDQPETKEKYYPDGTIILGDFVDEVYANLFNRVPDSEGYDYWVYELYTESVHVSTFILAVINGALGTDATILENKTIVGLAFANFGFDDVDLAIEIMSGITDDYATVLAALERLSALAGGNTEEYVSITEELNGTTSMNSETGVSIYESEEIEIKPGLLFKRSSVLTPKGPDNDQLGYSAMSILKFTNTTGSEETTNYIEDIPKSFATHVDQLEYKVLMDQSPNLTITDLLNESSSFVSIDNLVNEGKVEVLEEDPKLLILLGGALFAGVEYMFFHHPEILGFTSISTHDEIDDKNDEERKEWVEDKLLTEYCSAIRRSAETNNIPAKLLANIVLNEMADYNQIDVLQETFYTGVNRSHGWPQLQPQRIIDHRLIDIGTVDEIRDPTVDIVEDDLTSVIISDGMPIIIKTPINSKIWERLITPESGIELAAREIAYLLDMFKKGSEALNNPWAKTLLKNPVEGIDRNNIYANLKVMPDDQNLPQVKLDRTLAVLVAAGYNGGGNIFERTEEKDVFTDIELSWIAIKNDENETIGYDYDKLLEHNSPWIGPNDISNLNTETNNYYYSFANPRIHAEQAGTLFPKVLHESQCLDETALWPNYPDAEYCSMKEDARAEAFIINTNVEIVDETFVLCQYYASGELIVEIPYEDSVSEGFIKRYDENGDLWMWELVEDGVLIDASYN